MKRRFQLCAIMMAALMCVLCACGEGEEELLDGDGGPLSGEAIVDGAGAIYGEDDEQGGQASSQGSVQESSPESSKASSGENSQEGNLESSPEDSQEAPSQDSSVESTPDGTQGADSQGATPQEAGAQETSSQEAPSQESGSSDQNPSSSAPSTAYDLSRVLFQAEAQEAELRKKMLDTDHFGSGDKVCQEIYGLWDDLLNELWGQIKAVYSEKEMAALTEEERSWIASKEEKVQGEVSLHEGLAEYYAAMIEARKGAELTRERVYELAAALGEKSGQSVTKPPRDANAGYYVDDYDTDSVYSELYLEEAGEGTYDVEIGIYRLTTLTGTARAEGDGYLFESTEPVVKGEISIGEEGAVFTVTESEFTYMAPGETFSFPVRLY